MKIYCVATLIFSASGAWRQINNRVLLKHMTRNNAANIIMYSVKFYTKRRNSSIFMHNKIQDKRLSVSYKEGIKTFLYIPFLSFYVQYKFGLIFGFVVDSFICAWKYHLEKLLFGERYHKYITNISSYHTSFTHRII